MQITILTLFTEMFEGVFEHSIIKRARQKGLVEIELVNIRDFAKDKHKTVDDRPFGGGAGMILRVDVIDGALSSILNRHPESNRHPELVSGSSKSSVPKPHFHRTENLVRGSRGLRQVRNDGVAVILLEASGKPFKQKHAQKLSKLDRLILIAGRYEGVDERVREHLVDETYSIGDYVLTGGEIPAMVITDAVTRLIPGVLEKEAVESESFSKYTIEQSNNRTIEQSLLEPPQYTRPAEYKGLKVPEVLLSGNHREIEKWRKEKALERTEEVRPDLLN